MKFIILVSTIIKDENNRILFVVEKKEKILNKLNFPGGHLEFGETLIQGAKREVKEEVSIDIELNGFVGLYTGVKEDQYLHFIFAGETISDKAKANTDEVKGIAWYLLDDLDKLQDEILISPNKFKEIIKDYKSGRLIALDIIKNLKVES